MQYIMDYVQQDQNAQFFIAKKKGKEKVEIQGYIIQSMNKYNSYISTKQYPEAGKLGLSLFTKTAELWFLFIKTKSLKNHKRIIVGDIYSRVEYRFCHKSQH